MNIIFILSQVCAFIGVAISLAGKMMKNKKYLLLFSTVSSIFYVLSYSFLRAPISAILNGLAIIRAVSFMIMDKRNLPFKYYLIPISILFIAIAISMGFLWEGYSDVLIIIGFVESTLALAIKNTLFIRLGLILNSLMWMINNIILSAYVNLATDILNILTLIVAIIIYNFILPRRQRKDKEKKSSSVMIESDMNKENINN